MPSNPKSSLPVTGFDSGSTEHTHGGTQLARAHRTRDQGPIRIVHPVVVQVCKSAGGELGHDPLCVGDRAASASVWESSF